MAPVKKNLLYEGKAKRVYATDDENLVIQEFKDDATAFDGKKKGTIVAKGEVNNQVASHLFGYLEGKGIPTHFVERLSNREMLIKRLQILPVEVVVRNVTAGSFCRRYKVKEAMVLKYPIMEFFLKNDDLGDPLIAESMIYAMEWATREEMQEVIKLTEAINTHLSAFFEERKIKLVDFKLEFGRHRGKILLGDEISPDTCRLWDMETSEKLDKDRFRFDLGNVEGAYREILKRVTE